MLRKERGIDLGTLPSISVTVLNEHLLNEQMKKIKACK